MEVAALFLTSKNGCCSYADVVRTPLLCQENAVNGLENRCPKGLGGSSPSPSANRSAGQST